MKVNYIENQICNTLINLLKEKELDKLTVKEVCLKAEVGRASFYRYYNSLGEVLFKNSLKLMMEWETQLEEDPQMSADRLFETLFSHFQVHKEFYSILYRYQQTQVILDTIKDKIELTENIPNESAYGKSFFAYAIFGWINEWISRGMSESPAQLNQLFQEQAGVILGTLQALYLSE